MIDLAKWKVRKKLKKFLLLTCTVYFLYKKTSITSSMAFSMARAKYSGSLTDFLETVASMTSRQELAESLKHG